MSQGLWDAVRSMGEEGFSRRMEGISSSERREIFQQLDVPAGGASVSARRRTERRIHLAWERLAGSGDEEACEILARAWLGRQAMPMIVDFLDRMGVAHNDGYLREEDALRKLQPEKVAEVLRELAGRYDAADVRLYAALMELPGSAEIAA